MVEAPAATPRSQSRRPDGGSSRSSSARGQPLLTRSEAGGSGGSYQPLQRTPLLARSVAGGSSSSSSLQRGFLPRSARPSTEATRSLHSSRQPPQWAVAAQSPSSTSVPNGVVVVSSLSFAAAPLPSTSVPNGVGEETPHQSAAAAPPPSSVLNGAVVIDCISRRLPCRRRRRPPFQMELIWRFKLLLCEKNYQPSLPQKASSLTPMSQPRAHSLCQQ